MRVAEGRHRLSRLTCRLAAVLAAGAVMQAAAQPAAPPAERLTLCAVCHGPQGQSRIPTIPSLAGQPRIFLENQLVLIREGLREVPEMKGMLAGLKDEELVTLARYFNEQKPPPAAAGPARQASVERGRALSKQALCGTCHLADYRGQQQVPRLSGQNEVFLRASMQQFRDRPGPGRDTIMAATLRGLSDADLDDLAHYLAHAPSGPAAER